MSLKDILSPFYVWKRAFEKPYVIKKPLEDRPGAPNYRGFHINDMEKCIGCGSCEAICQNAAIDMVPVEEIETTKQDSGLRPRIDYGRCCWCALCVDICTTGSLGMANEYQWVDSDPEVFRYVPGIDKKSWDDAELGYKRAENYWLLSRERMEMEELEPEERVKSFVEMIRGYSKEQAEKEALRCVQCGLCVATCPAHMEIPQYIQAIREGNLEEGLRLLYNTNPMSAICGRICTHRCEEVCAMGHLGDPIAIRWLKRYIIDQFPLSEYSKILDEEVVPKGKKIAIIGAGPGGLSAAYYLNRQGYVVKIFEAHEKPGGMLRYGVPEYRLPYDQLDKDIDYIKFLGVEIVCNTKVGKDIDFMKLYKEYDALFFSTGLDQPYDIRIEGEDLPGVISGLELLGVVTKGERPELGEKVVVVGGGNVAMDAARTARRLGCDVTIAYRRREVDMPADEEEIVGAKEEGVEIVTQAIPVEIQKMEDGKLNFVWGKAKMIEQGIGKRPKPVLIEDEIYSISTDTVISAIGQSGDYSFLPKEIQEKLSFKWGKVVVEPNRQTGDPRIFAGGDIANSTADAISAIADGHNAAIGIDKYLRE